jgi:HK97 family phage major capsid protein
MDLKAMRAAAFKSANDINELAKSEARDLTTEEEASVAAFITEIESLDAKIEAGVKSAATAARLSGLSAKGDDMIQTKSAPKAAKSLGEHAARELDVEGFKSGKVARSASTEYTKAAGDTTLVGNTTVVDVDRNPVGATRERLTVADLLGAGQVSGNAITYFVELARQGDINAVAEGNLKAKVTYTYDEVTEKLSKIAGLTDVSDEMLEDLPFITSMINGNLVADLLLAEEQQLLNGDGTGANVKGLTKRSGVLTEASASKADNVDAIFRGDTKVSIATGRQVTGRIMHPVDYEALRLAKNANDDYYGGGPFATGPAVRDVWGVPTVVTTAIAQGTVLSGAFNTATVLRKGGVKVDISRDNRDNFETNKATFRAEERLGLMVPKPGALVLVTLSNV